MRRHLTSRALTLGALCFAYLSAPAHAALDERVVTSRIYGGQKVQGCAWPSVLSMGGCSAVLVHPKVLLTAAHCQPETRQSFVQVGNDSEDPNARLHEIASCNSFPGFVGNFGDGVDWAYCVLKEPIHDIPIVPVMSECERAAWSRTALQDQVVMVGFGKDEVGQSGIKREVTVPVMELNGDEIRAGGDGKAGCFGDSGGPAFVQLPDQTWRVMGIISYARGKCGNSEYLASVPAALSWLHEELAEFGTDITPCTDRHGVWVGGPYCADFPTNPQNPSCEIQTQKVGGNTQSCTSPFGQKLPAPQVMAPQSGLPKPPAQLPPAVPSADRAPSTDTEHQDPVEFSLGCSSSATSLPASGAWLLGLVLFGLRRSRRCKASTIEPNSSARAA